MHIHIPTFRVQTGGPVPTTSIIIFLRRKIKKKLNFSPVQKNKGSDQVFSFSFSLKGIESFSMVPLRVYRPSIFGGASVYGVSSISRCCRSSIWMVWEKPTWALPRASGVPSYSSTTAQLLQLYSLGIIQPGYTASQHTSLSPIVRLSPITLHRAPMSSLESHRALSETGCLPS